MTNLITLDTVKANAPIFRFHPNETCFPCSIEYMLQGATLNQNTTPHMTPLPNPTFSLLSEYSSSEYFVAINPSQYHGMEQSGNITAPIYYALQQVNQAGPNEPAGNYPAVDIHYIVWYANQDGQTLKVFGAKAFNYSTLGISELFDLKNATDPMPIIVRTYGEHQGDQERVVVRLSLQNLQVLGVGYDAHGETQWQTPGQYPAQGTHPISYVALTGHSDHPIPDNAIMHDYFIIESNQTVLQVGSVLSNAGIQWLPADYRFLGIDSAGQAIGPEMWVKFTGYFGAYEEHALESATYWNGQNLASVDWTYVQSVALGANIIGLLPDEFKHHSGTTALPTHNWALGPRPIPADGTTLRETSAAPIYVLRNGQKCWISTPDILNTQFGGFGNVQVVSDGSLVQIPSGPSIFAEGAVVRETSTEAIYAIRNNQKCLVTSPDILNAQFGGPGKVEIIPDGFMALTPMGPAIFAEGELVKETSSAPIYVIRDNQKCWISSQYVLDTQFGGLAGPAKVQIVPDGLLTQLPTGPTVFMEGAVVKETSDPRVYAIRLSQKCWISSMVILNADYGGAGRIQIVPDGALAQTPVGASIFLDGTVVKETSDPRIFVIHNSLKCWITTPAILNAQFGGFGNVQIVPDGALAKINEGQEYK